MLVDDMSKISPPDKLPALSSGATSATQALTSKAGIGSSMLASAPQSIGIGLATQGLSSLLSNAFNKSNASDAMSNQMKLMDHANDLQRENNRRAMLDKRVSLQNAGMNLNSEQGFSPALSASTPSAPQAEAPSASGDNVLSALVNMFKAPSEVAVNEANAKATTEKLPVELQKMLQDIEHSKASVEEIHENCRKIGLEADFIRDSSPLLIKKLVNEIALLGSQKHLTDEQSKECIAHVKLMNQQISNLAEELKLTQSQRKQLDMYLEQMFPLEVKQLHKYVDENGILDRQMQEQENQIWIGKFQRQVNKIIGPKKSAELQKDLQQAQVVSQYIGAITGAVTSVGAALCGLKYLGIGAKGASLVPRYVTTFSR